MATFRLQVVSMDGLEYDGEVQRVKLRTIHGDLAILARHMNYVTFDDEQSLPSHPHDLGMGRRY